MSIAPLYRLAEALDRFLEAARRTRRERRTAPMVKGLERAMEKAFRAQGKAFMEKFAALKGKFPKEEPAVEEAIRFLDWEPFFDEAELETIEAFRNPITLFASRALSTGASQIIADLKAGISFDLKNPRAVAYLKAVGADKVTKINDTTRETIKGLVTRAADEGWSYDRTAKEITDRFEEFAVGKPQEHIDSRAHLVAVTEAGNGFEAGSRAVVQDLQDAGLEMEKSWLTVNDSNVSEGCQENQDAGWIPADDAFPSGDDAPLRFPGCLPAGQVVIAEGILGATKRFFDGELVIINTAQGKEFSCTPNHPVLTPRGWVAAGLLNEGDKIVCCDLGQRVTSAPGVDDENVPAGIEQVVESFRLGRKLAAHPMKVSAPHFHGDGGGSKVAVVWADSPLRHSLNIASGQGVPHGGFIRPNVTWFSFAPKGHSTALLKGVSAFGSFVSSGGEAGVLFGGALGAHQAVGCQGVPDRNTGRKQAAANYSTGNAKGASKGVLGFTSQIAGDYLGIRQVALIGMHKALASVAFPTYTGPVQVFQDGSDVDAQSYGDLIHGMPGLVSVDDVLNVKRRKFRGHVYNLQTKSGYYTTSTVVVHNCRCTALYRRVGSED